MTNINAAALYNACLAGDAAAVSRLLPAGGTPRNLSGQRFQFNNTKTTPLMAAAEGGHTEIVRMMLERARNTIVDYADAQGYTAQHMAVQYHNVDILRLLADCGANVNLATCRGDTALRLTVGRVNPDSRPRDSDPDGARQIATVKALLHIGAGALPPRPIPPPSAQPCCHNVIARRSCGHLGGRVSGFSGFFNSCLLMNYVLPSPSNMLPLPTG